MNMYGTNILSAADELRKVTEEQIFHLLQNPKPELAARLQQLRIVYAMDAKRYAVLKRELPYFVCGIFAPAFRRKENFAYTESFLIDIDHIAAKGLSLQETRKRIQADPQVFMCFSSPGQDGLKVMFRLSQRCYDAGLYSLFYKAFAREFSNRYNLQQVLDTKTSDVTRACFISMDAQAYFNPQCQPVDLTAFVDPNNPAALLDLKRDAEQNPPTPATPTQANHPTDPDQSVLDRIRQRLNPKNTPEPRALPVEVPAMLNDIIDDIKLYIQETGLVVTEIINIQYAKKIRVSLGLKQAEVNLFYGKRGFSVVVSPRRGTDAELNNLVADLIRAFIDTH